MSLDAAIGPFILDAEIGRGGMARVYSAHHHKDGALVALKVLRPEIARDEHFAEAFAFEVQAAARLDHPRVTAVFDHGVIDPKAPQDKLLLAGSPWLAMELVPGGSISKLCGTVSWNQLRSILLDVLDALAHAHARGTVHRDIKPANVLMDYEIGRVQVTDFGLAHSIRGGASTTLGLGEAVAGTPAFMAPEQIQSKWRDFGPQTDLYALGAMAWALATGNPPYAGEMPQAFSGHLSGVLPKFEPSHPMPAGLGDWLAGMMRLRPEDRFGRAADAAWALSRLEGVVDAPRDEAQDQLTFSLDTMVLDPAEPTVFSPAPIASAPSALDMGPNVAGIRAPVSKEWRISRRARRHLHGAGLALFGQRALDLVGREAEREHLWATLHDAIGQRCPHLVVVQGPEGCGKSTLARWLGERAEELGAASLLIATHGEAGGAGEGLGPMLERHLRLQGMDRKSAVDRVSEILQRLGVDDREEAVALTELAQPTGADAVRKPGLGVRFGGAKERHTVLGRYLCLLAQQRPVVLWLDDVLHNQDTVEFAAHLLDHAADTPVVIIATVTSELRAAEPLAADRLSEISNHPRASQIDVKPLDREEQSALVRDMLGLEPEVAAQVEARSAGNPMFAVQLVGDWVQRGLLVVGDSGFGLADGADVRLPSSLLEVWNERLGQLIEGRTVEQVQALELAALLGQDVIEAEWSDVCEMAGLFVPALLVTELLRQNLAVSTDDQGNWSFVHAMLREVIVEHAATHGRKKQWASLCADALEGRPTMVARRARLLLDAERFAEAPTILQDGINHLLRHGETARAWGLFSLRTKALAQAGETVSEEQALITGALELMLIHDSGDVERAALGAPELIELVDRCTDPATIGMVLKAVSMVMVAEGKLDLARDQLERGIEVVREAGLTGRYAIYCNGLAFLYLRMGEFKGVKQAARKAVAAGEAVGDTTTVARGYTMLAQGYLQAGEPAQAQFYAQEARLRYEAVGSRWGLASIWNTTGEVLREVGDPTGALEAYSTAAERFDACACGPGWGVFPRLNSGLVMAETGQHAEALEIWDRVSQELVESGRKGLIVMLHVFKLPSLGRLGRWSEVEQALASAEVELEQSGMVDLDLARFARRAALVCEDAGKVPLAVRAWAIAHTQWTALDRPEEAAEAAARKAVY